MKNLAAAVGLIPDKGGIFGELRLIREFIKQLCAGEFDGCEGSAKLMRGGGDDAAKVRELLLSGKGHLRCGECLRHGGHFRNHAAGIER